MVRVLCVSSFNLGLNVLLLREGNIGQQFVINGFGVLGSFRKFRIAVCHLLALVGARHIVHVSRVRVKLTVLQCVFAKTQCVDTCGLWLVVVASFVTAELANLF